jgi:citrate lyase beta subunit
VPELGVIRSALFVPGSRLDRVDKACASSADVVIIDLEDAVAPDQKEAARAGVAQKLASLKPGRAMVRVNGPETPHFAQDLEAVLHENLAGVVVPMVETPRHISDIHQALYNREIGKGLPAGGLKVIAQIETALAVEGISGIARAGAGCGRLHTVAFWGCGLQPGSGHRDNPGRRRVALPPLPPAHRLPGRRAGGAHRYPLHD